MRPTSERFRTFLSSIQLTDLQVQDAITKHTGVRKTLHNAYYSGGSALSYRVPSVYETPTQELLVYKNRLLQSYKQSDVLIDEGYAHTTSLLVGSYGKNTAISPPSDIDILFIMPPDLFARYNSYISNGQSQLLQDVKKVLQKTYPLTDIRADGQVVSVPFLSYRVEVLPAFKLITGQYYYPDTHFGGSWKRTNPEAEKRFLRESNKRSKGNTIKLIKMLKAWKRQCTVPIKSLVLELEAVRFLNSWEYYDKSETFFDWMTRDFFGKLKESANGSRLIPGIDESVYYGDAWLTKAKTAHSTSCKACEHELNKEFVKATQEWKKIFGYRFSY